MKRTALLLILLEISYCQKAKPNILIITGSEIGWKDIGVNNPSITSTKNIDKLASGGISYTDYHNDRNSASSSMAAILTGRHTQRTGVRNNFTPFSLGGLPGDERTVADYLKSIGYTAGFIGEWNLGHQPQFLPLSRGFDFFYGTPFDPTLGCVHENKLFIVTNGNLSCSSEKIGVPLMEGNKILEQPLNMGNISMPILVAKAEKFIHKAGELQEPFFLVISLNKMNLPMFSLNNLGNSKKDFILNHYDEAVAMLQELLQKYNITHTTLSVFTSKTSPGDASCGSSIDGGPYNQTMNLHWEEPTRVPLIVSWFPEMSAFHKSTWLTSAVDLVPTIAEVTGLNLPEDRTFDGMSITKGWKADKSNAAPSRILYFPESDSNQIMALRTNNLNVDFSTSGTRKCNSTNYHSKKNILSYPLVFNLTLESGKRQNISYDSSLAASLLQYKKDGDDMFSGEKGMKSIADYSESTSAVACCKASCECSSSASITDLLLFMLNKQPSSNKAADPVVIKMDHVMSKFVAIYGIVFICFVATVLVAIVMYKSYMAYFNLGKRWDYESISDPDTENIRIMSVDC